MRHITYINKLFISRKLPRQNFTRVLSWYSKLLRSLNEQKSRTCSRALQLLEIWLETICRHKLLLPLPPGLLTSERQIQHGSDCHVTSHPFQVQGQSEKLQQVVHPQKRNRKAASSSFSSLFPLHHHLPSDTDDENRIGPAAEGLGYCWPWFFLHTDLFVLLHYSFSKVLYKFLLQKFLNMGGINGRSNYFRICFSALIIFVCLQNTLANGEYDFYYFLFDKIVWHNFYFIYFIFHSKLKLG